jgi:phage terminase large subunit-like protein
VDDWLPTIRISDTEVTAITTAPDPVSSLRTLLRERGVPVASLAFE